MKYLYVLFLIFVSSNCYAKKITLDIPDKDIQVVENDVMDAEEWIRNAWNGKLNKCKERLIKQEVDTSIKNGEVIPSNENEIIDKALSRPNYKNRKEREKGE